VWRGLSVAGSPAHISLADDRSLSAASFGRIKSEGWPIVLKTIEGVYRDGKMELTEVPADVRGETRVLVTFLISAAPKAAAPLKPRTSIY
jgi:hypothetical protein